MIKIPLKFINNQIILPAIVSFPNYRVRYKPVQFIIDTGSSRSFLSEGDALRLQIPINRLSEDETIMRMGGSKYYLVKTKEFEMLLKDENNSGKTINLPSFAISRGTKKTQEAILESQNFPSIIGTDFFVLNNLKLHFSPNSKEIYLGMEDSN